MARPARRNLRAPSATEMHRQWLELVDSDGPFLAIPPLKRVWSNGIPDFRNSHPDRFDVLVSAHREFVQAWDALDRDPEGETRLSTYRTARDAWVETVLRDVMGWSESLNWGTVPGVRAQSPNRVVTVTAQAILVGADDTPAALVHVVDATDSLRQTPNDLWAATPIDRCEALLRENHVEIGVVTDGRWWGLVCAAEGRMAASGVVDALTWVEEPRTRDAFLTLLGRQYLIGGDPDERLPKLFADSVAEAEEITEALGAQVRRAVELLIQSFSESAAEARRRGVPHPLPARTHDIYEAAVTVMMRTVFLLFAEERGLLPSGELFEQGYGMAGVLGKLSAREVEEGEEALDSTSRAWHRLLATSRALYAGASFENLRMPAYGGSLFDPDRFPFLTTTNEHGSLAISVSDRVMLHVLRSVQIAQVQGEARQISFRDIDVEQIGYIYEGLLGYTCTTVDETYLGIIGSSGAEPEIPLAKLEALDAVNSTSWKLAEAIRAWVESDQPSAKTSSVAAMAKAIDAEPDPSLVSALNQAVGDDYELRDRIKPWLGLIRKDLRQYPFVVVEGGLLVKETPSRKNAGAHYTPRSLAEEVVLHALQPLCYSPGPHQIADESAWRLKSSDELLGLKIADIACGSGAFLVAAGRYLADRVVEAWISEDPANARRRDLHTRAIRQVVANCLYGADINDMAVEMCKLSLWLISLDRDLPFSFVDDKVFLGNSLLGVTDRDQIRKLHIDPSRVPPDQMFDIFDVDIDAILGRAVALRERLASEIMEDDPARSSAAKQRQLAQLRALTSELRQISDGIVAAGLRLGGGPGRDLDDSYETLRVAVKAAHPDLGEPNRALLGALCSAGLVPFVATDYERWQPLHWVLEAPDVMLERKGFDAVVGNPPFLGGLKLSGALGGNVRDWLINQIANGARGAADMVAYFFLRASRLLNPTGCLGLIGTNTLAQGDTREVGLDAMVAGGFTITRSIQSSPWPSASANLEFAAVWGTAATVSDGVPRVADGRATSGITPYLEPVGRASGAPHRLAENASKAFVGCYVFGAGFIVPDVVRSAWLSIDPKYAEVVLPYINGQDLTSRPNLSPSRWVIDFGQRTEREAAAYPLALARVRELVKPERDKQKIASRRELWWRFAGSAPSLRAAIADLDRVVSIALTSSAMRPVRVPTGPVFDQTAIVFALDDAADFAVLSSDIHQAWAIRYGATLETRLRYTPSDVFVTFPRPKASSSALRVAGSTLDSGRSEVMKRRNLGLTKLYNLVNDPSVTTDTDILEIRQMHVAVDRAVADAYGWGDIHLEHGFHEYRQVVRWTIGAPARAEVLDRLLEENHRRAAAEASIGRSTARGHRQAATTDGMEALFS